MIVRLTISNPIIKCQHGKFIIRESQLSCIRSCKCNQFIIRKYRNIYLVLKLGCQIGILVKQPLDLCLLVFQYDQKTSCITLHCQTQCHHRCIRQASCFLNDQRSAFQLSKCLIDISGVQLLSADLGKSAAFYTLQLL